MGSYCFNLLNIFLALVVVGCASRIVATEEVQSGREKSEIQWLENLGINTRFGAPTVSTLDNACHLKPFSPTEFIHWERKEKQRLSSEGVARDALLADLQTLQCVFLNNYGGYKIAPNKIDTLFVEWSRFLRDQNDRIPLDVAFKPWLDFKYNNIDNHTQPMVHFTAGGFETNGSRTFLHENPNRWCSKISFTNDKIFIDKEVKYERLLNQNFKAVQAFSLPRKYEENMRVKCDEKIISVKSLKTSNRREIEKLHGLLNDRVSYSVNNNIGFLRIPTMTSRVVSSISEIKLPAQLPAFNVIDLRGNEGGAGTPFFSVISKVLKISIEDTTIVADDDVRISSLTPVLVYGFFQNFYINESSRLKNEELIGAQRIYDNLFQAPNYESSAVLAKKGYKELPVKLNDTRVIVLVDENTGSDAEFLVHALRSFPGVVVAGAYTYGVSEFIQPTVFKLPRTGIFFRMAIGRLDHYGDGRPVDGYGLAPDVIVDDMSANSITRFARSTFCRKDQIC